MSARHFQNPHLINDGKKEKANKLEFFLGMGSDFGQHSAIDCPIGLSSKSVLFSFYRHIQPKLRSYPVLIFTLTVLISSCCQKPLPLSVHRSIKSKCDYWEGSSKALSGSARFKCVHTPGCSTWISRHTMPLGKRDWCLLASITCKSAIFCFLRSFPW